MRGALIARMSLSAAAVLLLLLVLVGCATALKPTFNPRATYSSIKKTEPGLREYKAKCIKQLDTLDKRLSETETVFVTTTFTRYLSKEEVDRLIKDYRLDIHLIISRCLETETGLRGTVGEKSYKGKHRRDFIGFTEVVAYVPKKRLKGFAADDLVFLVDPSGDPHLVSNPDKDYMPGVFWTLEDLNMLAQDTAMLSLETIDLQTKKGLPAPITATR